MADALTSGPAGAGRLEIGAFPVGRVTLGDVTSYADGTLTIDPRLARALVLRDHRIADVALDVAHPGDRVRILRALDAVEPMVKVAGGSSVFPGFLGEPRTCGHGRTHRLNGCSVIAVAEFPFPARGVQAFEEGVIEMSGPGAEFSGGADRANLVLTFAPGRVSDNVDYDDAIRRAALRVAESLAAVTRDLAPSALETIGPATPRAARDVPRVVWVHQVRAQGPMVQTFLYGHEMSGMVPTLLHPGEILDGALVSGNYKTGSKTPTYRHTRHPALLELLARDGEDLHLVGVVVARGHHETEFLKRRSAAFVAKLASLVAADAALCTYEATGNTHIDFMLTLQELERAGVATSAVVHEYGGPDGSDASLVDFVPEAVALASSGGIDRRVKLPAVARVIGGTQLAHRGEPAHGPLDLPIQELYAATVEMNARGVLATET